MDDNSLLTIIILIAVLFVAGWLLRFCASLIVFFTAFIIELPLVISILLFILFPPTIIAFLIGLLLIDFSNNEPDNDLKLTRDKGDKIISKEEEEYKHRQRDLWRGD